MSQPGITLGTEETPGDAIELALCAAIAARLGAARGRLNKTELQPFRPTAAADPEESLRVFMTRLWPRVAEGRATSDDLSTFYATLGELWQPAHSTDLRFLDAWNNAYEAAPHAFPQPFVAAYVELLEAHISRLRDKDRRHA